MEDSNGLLAAHFTIMASTPLRCLLPSIMLAFKEDLFLPAASDSHHPQTDI